MRNTLRMTILLVAALLACMPADGRIRKQRQKADLWPDGTEISAWFSDTAHVDISTLGTPYVVTDYGVKVERDRRTYNLLSPQ